MTVRKKLGGYLVLLFVEVAVFVLALMWVENPVVKWLVCIAVGFSGIVTATVVARMSAQIGRQNE